MKTTLSSNKRVELVLQTSGVKKQWGGEAKSISNVNNIRMNFQDKMSFPSFQENYLSLEAGHLHTVLVIT